MTDPLSTWKDGAVKNAILGYVGQTCAKGSADWVPAEERVAVFDNDGTLWCEKPMPIQLDFVLRRLAEMAELDPALRDRQPWKAGTPPRSCVGVIGSAVALTYTPDEHGGAITRRMAAEYPDDGPEKPVHIWNRTGRRPVLAAGNSNGDIEMLDFTEHRGKRSVRLLVLHDDADREFDYVSGAERALGRAASTAGRWSASRATGPRCSDHLPAHRSPGSPPPGEVKAGAGDQARREAVPLGCLPPRVTH